MTKLTFKQLYAATKEVLKQAKEPFVLNKNKRAFESSIDSIKVQILEFETEIQQELEVVKDQKVIDVQKVIDNIRKKKECEEILKEIIELKKAFFEGTPTIEED